MIFRITHQVRYAYSDSVFLEPHILRLHPRDDPSQQIRGFTVVVTPQPAGSHDFLDAEGNRATCLWFNGKIASLAVSTSFEAQTFQETPFNYLVTDNSFLQLPAKYGGSDGVALGPFLEAVEPDKELRSLVASIVDKAGGNTLDFLLLLNTAIYEECTVEIRDHGPPWPPAVTWRNKRGACRDLAVLFIAACRGVGLAARFVSGYQEGDQDMEHRHLHAWPEVYIPGGGWRGYDPTHGLVVADRHVALAASYHSDGAAPVTGTFRGTGITARMKYAIGLISRRG